MRRRLMKHEQNVFPFVVDSRHIYSGESPLSGEPQEYNCIGLETHDGAQTAAGKAHLTIGKQALSAHYHISGETADIVIDGFFYRFQTVSFSTSGAGGGAQQALRAEIPGRIIKVLIKAGDVVAAGDVLLVQEAMKMEMSLKAAFGARVANVLVTAGSQVEADALLVEFEAE